LIAFPFAAAWLACGGDDTIAPSGGGDAGSDVTVADTGGGQPDTSTADTSPGDDTSTTDAPQGDGGGDAQLDVQLVQDTGSTLTDAGPGGDGAVLSCGSASCNLPNQTCCVYPEPPSFFVACSNGAACPTIFANPDAGDGGDAGPVLSAAQLQCEISANCPNSNNQCCITVDPSGKVSAHCTSSCPNGAILCDPNAAADAGECAADAGCSAANIGSWSLPNGFGTCGGRAVDGG
jgi:hypothetical protein